MVRSTFPCLDGPAANDCQAVATRFDALDLDMELDKLRLREDPNPETGELIHWIATDGGLLPQEDYGRVQAFYKKLARTRYLDLTHFKGEKYETELKSWAATIKIPIGVDRPKLRNAGKFFKSQLFKITMILGTSSLLEAYASWKGVHVLCQTGQLSKHANRRLAESWQFVMYVCEPDGFDPSKGRALDAIRRIRLMHGGIRWLILNDEKRKVPRLPKPQPWDTNTYGLPINGEDLLGMMLGFSRVITRDLPKIGSPVTPDEAEDYRYLWDVIGEMLGVEAPLRPRTVDEAAQLFCAIKRRQQTKDCVLDCDDGAKMARALLDFYTTWKGIPSGLRAFLRRRMVALMRHLVGDFVCDLVRLPQAGTFAQLVAGADSGLIDALGAAVLGHAGVTVLKMPVKPYQIPRSLLSNFG